MITIGNAFITGIRGFIPGHLALALHKAGYAVYGIDNNMHPAHIPEVSNSYGIGIIYGDVRYYEDIDQYVEKADIVYHMAAQINVDKSIAHPQETFDINLQGTVNVLNACKRYKKPLVFASTSEIYGTHFEPIKENFQNYAPSPYAVSKLAADKLCGNYHNLYGLEVYRVRSFNIFGPYQSDDECGAVIPRFTTYAMNHEPMQIYGDGEQKRDFTYIEDIVSAYVKIPKIKELSGKTINIGTGDTWSINYIAKTINELVGNEKFEVEHVNERKGEVRQLQAATEYTELQDKYGLKPKIQFKEGLMKYIAWRKLN